MATGLLVVCLGDATRFVPYLTGLDKAYEATVQLGFATTTDDREGEALNAPVAVTAAMVDLAASAMLNMVGTFEQVPPRVSAIKVDGRRSYDRAREGEVFELPARPVTIHALNVLEAGPSWLRIHVAVSKGTFIRSIARDAGNLAGCGGHLEALRRTTVGAVDVSAATPLAAIVEDASVRDECLMSPFSALGHLPAFALDEAGCARLRFGQRPTLDGSVPVPAIGSIVRVVAIESGAFLGLAEVEATEDDAARLRVIRLNPTGEASE